MYKNIIFSFQIVHIIIILYIIIIPNHLIDPLVLLWWWQSLLQKILKSMVIYMYLEMPPNKIWSPIIDDIEDGHHVFLIGIIPKFLSHNCLPMKSKGHFSCISMNTRPHPKALHSKKNILVKLSILRTNKVHMISHELNKYWLMVSFQTKEVFLSRVVKGVIIFP